MKMSGTPSVKDNVRYEPSGPGKAVPSTSHHEAVGTVERFHQTLIQMARASDEGGRYWLDHLPYLLLAYRSTPNRTSKLSPAELIYGRRLRLGAAAERRHRA